MGPRKSGIRAFATGLAALVGLMAGVRHGFAQSPLPALTVSTRAAGPETGPPAAAPFPAPAADRNLEQRVRELEDALRMLQGPGQTTREAPTALVQDANPNAGPGEAQGLPSHPIPLETSSAPGMFGGATGAGASTAGWSNGFFLRSSDNNFQLRITGQIQADVRDFLRHVDAVDISTFLVRRARLGIEATVFKYYEFRLLPDFGQGKTVIQDAYINIHYLDEAQVAGGKFKQPVSYEQLIQDRFVPTVERSIIDQLVPARDPGLMLHGERLMGNTLDYAVGVFNGGINGDLDTNGHKDIAWRIAGRPLNFDALPESVHLLQVGISGTTGVEEEPITPAVLRTPATVPFLTYNSAVRANGLRNRWTPEASYFYGGLGLAAQYYYETQQMAPSAALLAKTVSVPFEGYYVMGTYLLTGEQRTTYSAPVVPLRPFDPAHPLANPGAWELVARYSYLDVGSVVFAPGAAQLANPKTNARIASELTLGFNWYFNAWVRVQFNWEHARFSSPVQLGPPPFGLLRGQDTVLGRLQVIF